MDTRNATSLIIPVPETSFVQPFREKYLQRPGVTMPPHITIQSPFLPADTIDATVLAKLEELCASHHQFSYELGAIKRFEKPGVLYLAPNPVGPFEELTRAVRRLFDLDSRGSVYHLTLAGWHPEELDTLEDEFTAVYGNRIPVAAHATELCLYRPKPSRWLESARFSFLL